MVTTRDRNGKLMTRNCSLFKKAPPGINDDGELEVLPRGSTSAHGEAVENRQAVVQEQTNVQDAQNVVERRFPTRTRRQVNRFVAGPASGLYRNN